MDFRYAFAAAIPLAEDAIIWSSLEVVTHFFQRVNKAVNRFRKKSIKQHDICSSLQTASVCEAIKPFGFECLRKNLCRQIGVLLVFSVNRARKGAADVIPNVFIEFFRRRIFFK